MLCLCPEQKYCASAGIRGTDIHQLIRQLNREVHSKMTDGPPSVGAPSLAVAACSGSVSHLDWERTHDCLHSLPFPWKRKCVQNCISDSLTLCT